MKSDGALEGGSHPAEFATTRWSLILNGRISGDEGCPAHDALAQLCQIYWRPIFTFICRSGYVVTDAEDLTQDFFLVILKGKILETADPSRGRFRSLLLKSLKNFLINEDVKNHRLKRGGDIEFVSWEEWMAEAPSQLSIPARAFDSCSAEALFDFRWAATVSEQALRRLREECEGSGRRRLYEVLSDHLTAYRTDISYGCLSTALGVSTSSVKRLIHEFRRRYRTLLRDEIAQTLENKADVDDEVRYLCTALSTIAA